jgi:hypothetical protein
MCTGIRELCTTSFKVDEQPLYEVDRNTYPGYRVYNIPLTKYDREISFDS